ncbi:DotG/IcmE/VirB10 family protein [Pseudomonas aeruginosa]|uniref:DotG/IcmE/VirB10 family protein n=1 Tax=Pseudomonas aeruginosa TaxID=287 RepID=UPI001E59BCEF|nr:DotG/IcmE/VirB10 family protein [Pseudomonas aeruginosa]
MDNLIVALSDGPTRLIYGGSLLIMLIAAGAGYWFFTSNKKTTADPSYVNSYQRLQGPAVMSGGGPMPQSTPQYDAYNAQENSDNVRAAVQSGSSAVPTVRSGVTETVIEHPAPPKEKAPEEDPDAVRRRNEEREKQLPDAQKRYDEARRGNDEAIKPRKEPMSQLVGLLVKNWEPSCHKTLDINSTATANTASGAAAAGGNGQVGAASNEQQSPALKLARAGELQCGHVDTALNTDEPGPVLATIWEEGDLKRTKLLGQIETGQNAEKATLQFSTANIPGANGSVQDDAYAVDANTARTALGTHVDNQLVQRYGLFLAATYLEGYGTAIMQAGQNQQPVASASGTVVQTDALDNTLILSAAAGNVGNRVADSLADRVNRIPTISIDSGTADCFLFMIDVEFKGEGNK